jgi:large subunit ribosomal protein L9
MEVILTEDIPSLGKVGEVVKVREGYGRNYLLPNKKALVANSKNIKALEAQKKMLEAKAAKNLASADAVAKRLGELMLTFEREVGEENRLFGSVTNKDIAEELAKQGVPIDKHLIHLESPLKSVGDHEVEVKLHSQLKATLKVSVVPKSS